VSIAQRRRFHPLYAQCVCVGRWGRERPATGPRVDVVDMFVAHHSAVGGRPAIIITHERSYANSHHKILFFFFFCSTDPPAGFIFPLLSCKRICYFSFNIISSLLHVWRWLFIRLFFASLALYLLFFILFFIRFFCLFLFFYYSPPRAMNVFKHLHRSWLRQSDVDHFLFIFFVCFERWPQLFPLIFKSVCKTPAHAAGF
jgi:hypothetical protein